MNSKIWLSSPHMCGEEFNFVKEAFDMNWIAPLGPHVNGFESDLEAFTGARFVAALNYIFRQFYRLDNKYNKIKIRMS